MVDVKPNNWNSERKDAKETDVSLSRSKVGFVRERDDQLNLVGDDDRLQKMLIEKS